MRIWSIHPQYLDAKGLVALWREALLAKHVLEGRTKGYKNHPQLNRFKNTANPKKAINQYLAIVFEEACARGYQFDRKKINWRFKPVTLFVTRGQINFESAHLLAKLKKRDKVKFSEVKSKRRFKPHPQFKIVSGEIESWEII